MTALPTPDATGSAERPRRKDQFLGTTTSLSTVVGLVTGVLTLVNDPGGVCCIERSSAILTGDLPAEVPQVFFAAGFCA